uniref:CARMIL C-terminal domain-containing protein n=1 Tax=Callorhinchus milii TaxID=7868 RepID=A0A4W3JRB8_CALMI
PCVCVSLCGCLPLWVPVSLCVCECSGEWRDSTFIVIETEKISYSFKLMSLEDLEQVVSHVTASLKKIFPDSSPGKLLKKNTHELQERIWKITASLEDLKDSNQGPCGGYSETYTALCDYNGFPCKEEIQWDVDTIYHSQDTKEFNLLDFSHLDSRDVALCVAALAFNQWFIKLYSKDLRLNPDVVEQILYMLSMSSKLEEVVLENAGLKFDFGQKMALALEENPCPGIHTINLSSNQLEDRGKGHSLFFSMTSTQCLLTQIQLGPRSHFTSRPRLGSCYLPCVSIISVFLPCVGTPITTQPPADHRLHINTALGSFYSFLAQPNALSHLDLAGTDCALDAVSSQSEYTAPLVHMCPLLSCRKVREIPPSLKHFFRNCWSLKYVGLSGTKLPLEALRAVLQGLACNTHVSDVQLDLSNCELRSAGAQVIQDHIFDAKAISNLDLTDNGFDSDMVTLVLSLGRSKSLQHVSLGKNFNIKSKALVDVLHRIVQLIQDEECPLRSLSVADSRLKSGTCILINALGSNTCLRRIDISGNAMGDTGAKMLAKALQINTSLRTVAWDRNHTTAVGFLDVASALERNYTLKSMPLPMSDVAQAYRNNPEKTEEALGMGGGRRNHGLHRFGSFHTPFGMESCLCFHFSSQTLVQSLLDSTKSLCPNTLQKASVQEQLVNPVLSKISIPQNFVKSAIIEQAGLEIVNKLRSGKYLARRCVSEFNLERQVEEMDCLAEKQLLSVSGRPMSHPACVEIAFPVPPLTGSFTNLPTEGQKLEHYTRGRPKPNRTKRQPPSKPVVSLARQRPGWGFNTQQKSISQCAALNLNLGFCCSKTETKKLFAKRKIPQILEIRSRWEHSAGQAAPMEKSESTFRVHDPSSELKGPVLTKGRGPEMLTHFSP